MPSIELDKDIYRQLHPYCHSSGHVTNGSVSRNGKQNAVLFSLGPSNCSVGWLRRGGLFFVGYHCRTKRTLR